jgi:Flp pilus assembly protein TadG
MTLMPPTQRIARDEHGQAVVEFAIVLPLVTLLLFAVIQFGITYNHYVTLTDATRAGARKAAVSRYLGAGAASSACVNAVKASASDLKAASLQISCTSSWAPTADVVVNAKYPYSINLLGVVVKSGQLSSTTTERVE